MSPIHFDSDWDYMDYLDALDKAEDSEADYWRDDE